MPKQIRPRGLNARERKMIKLRVQGKTMKQIGDDLGTSDATVCVALKRLEPELREALAAAKYPLSKAIVKMVEMTDAKRVEFFQSNGIVMDSRVVEDNATRFQARKEMLRIHGVGNDVNVQHSGTIVHELTQKERDEARNSLQKILAYDSDSGTPLLGEYEDGDTGNQRRS